MTEVWVGGVQWRSSPLPLKEALGRWEGGSPHSLHSAQAGAAARLLALFNHGLPWDAKEGGRGVLLSRAGKHVAFTIGRVQVTQLDNVIIEEDLHTST